MVIVIAERFVFEIELHFGWIAYDIEC